jgi:hypothetical protein
MMHFDKIEIPDHLEIATDGEEIADWRKVTAE